MSRRCQNQCNIVQPLQYVQEVPRQRCRRVKRTCAVEPKAIIPMEFEIEQESMNNLPIYAVATPAPPCCEPCPDPCADPCADPCSKPCCSNRRKSDPCSGIRQMINNMCTFMCNTDDKRVLGCYGLILLALGMTGNYLLGDKFWFRSPPCGRSMKWYERAAGCCRSI